ncbi:tRNA 2-selenouridine(34) synthase MnmH [Fusibacter tunisiensis]|uniref:tRNA 2-selenouridine synthase n=1 Tax=Fusibacter tunisiensis TaxID=1008308 RepID=A0ABS2MTX7_9FIRM|nr:tRNA 2-selenouridine(34) synthase MnmH [Fusibacter tunisiensis]MBM7562805.1 tRNA 2-selenouridine synthase [Fusibacter tunisiensis]
MYKAIPFESCDEKTVFIDVRSESEFKKGHICGAINLPILNDLERHEVGWIYKNASVDEAKRVGLKHGSGKIQTFLDTINSITEELPNHKIVFYCARGGYRSRSIAMLLLGIDVPVHWLEGGYKNYRTEVLETLNTPDKIPNFIVLNGYTGVGKTHILEALQKLGQPVLDLEKAANHKGSHLGAIGTEGGQQTQLFENAIYHQLKSLKHAYCFIESESKRIGKVYVPNAIFDKLQRGSYIKLEASVAFRIEGLVKDYVNTPDFKSSFENALLRIKPYIGTSLYTEIRTLFHGEFYAELAEKLLIHHYDPIYQKSISAHDHIATFTVTNYEECAQEISNWISHSTLSQ